MVIKGCKLKYKLICKNNLEVDIVSIFNKKPNLIYCDMIYEDENLDWISHFWNTLDENGVFIIQTDYHTNYLVRYYFEKSGNIPRNEFEFINHCVWKNEWGNHPKDRYHQCYDDILFFAKGNHRFYSEKIQVLKATAKSRGLNPSGRNTKTATAWIDDICLTTISPERIKNSGGTCVRWQKPVALYERILSPFLDEGDVVLDPFMGVASVGEWCMINNINYIGIENNDEIYNLAQGRMWDVEEEISDYEKAIER